MTSGHPVDEQGRVLPDPAWPSGKAAPEPWDVIRRFCNTTNRESGADRFETAEGLRLWCDHEGLVAPMRTARDRERIVAFREHVRSHAVAHHNGTASVALSLAMAEQVANVDLTFAVSEGRLDVVPTPVGLVNQTIGSVARTIMSAQRADCWTRFKACPGCEWVFYDRSKNTSGRWCSMSACGGRAKVAAFRSRERKAMR